jgi:hypothetical protein
MIESARTSGSHAIVRSISFSDGIVVIEKGPKNEPFHVRAGWRALPLEAEVEKLKSEGRWLVE